LQQPTAQSRRAIVNGIAGGILLRLRPQRLGVTKDEVAQVGATADGMLEACGRNGGKLSRDLYEPAPERSPRTETALQTTAAFPAGRGGLDHVPVAGRDQLRDHPGMRKIDLVDRLAGAVTHDALRQCELTQIRLQ